MTHDLYKVLGVQHDADKATVHRAYRRAAKHAHPDKPGGSDKRFALVKLAHDTLYDDARRQHYDQTGEIDEKAPDNKLAQALQAIASAFEAVLAECKSAGRDPATRDLDNGMRTWIRAHLAASKKQIEEAEKEIAKTESLGRRFTGNTMDKIVIGRVTMLTSHLANIRRNMQAGDDALELMTDVRFTAEEKSKEPVNYYSLLKGF